VVLCQTVVTFQAAVLIKVRLAGGTGDEQRQEEWETTCWEDARDNNVNCTKCNQSLQDKTASLISFTGMHSL
jgi:hypothetical protein